MIGTSLSHFKITAKLGEGGMGEVWPAQQEDSARRMIALRVIKSGMDIRSSPASSPSAQL